MNEKLNVIFAWIVAVIVGVLAAMNFDKKIVFFLGVNFIFAFRSLSLGFVNGIEGAVSIGKNMELESRIGKIGIVFAGIVFGSIIGCIRGVFLGMYDGFYMLFHTDSMNENKKM